MIYESSGRRGVVTSKLYKSSFLQPFLSTLKNYFFQNERLKSCKLLNVLVESMVPTIGDHRARQSTFEFEFHQPSFSLRSEIKSNASYCIGYTCVSMIFKVLQPDVTASELSSGQTSWHVYMLAPQYGGLRIHTEMSVPKRSWSSVIVLNLILLLKLELRSLYPWGATF